MAVSNVYDEFNNYNKTVYNISLTGNEKVNNNQSTIVKILIVVTCMPVSGWNSAAF